MNISQTFPDEKLLIKRPCLAVGDIKRSLGVYQDILGFQLIYQNQADEDSYLYSVLNLSKEAKLTFAALSNPSNMRALALTEVKGIELILPTYYSCALVIEVCDIESKIEKLKQLNLDVIQPNYFTTQNNLSFREQAFSDYDGHRIMLYENLT